MQDEQVKNLLQKELGIEPITISVLTGGQVGHVYRADTADKSYVVKLVGAYEEPTFAEENRDDRVYGSRWSNLMPVYTLLKEKGIAVPNLYASGTLEDAKFHYEILDYLEGTPEDYSPEWFAALGKALGEMHQIRRSFQGWVAMEQSYVESWTEAFAKSLASQLEEAKPFLSEELYASISDFVSRLPALNEPHDFVLSHTDGFQGVLKKKGEEWRLQGVVDIEDHEFTDQRFVLAGLELQHSFNDRAVHPRFWEEYTRVTNLDATVDTYKNLFKVYYLIVWARVLRNQPALFENCIAKLSELVNSKEAI